MKVWVINHFDYGDIYVYSEDTDILRVPVVERELGYLEGEYEDEREEFLRDIKVTLKHGCGEATIEERIRVELYEVETL